MSEISEVLGVKGPDRTAETVAALRRALEREDDLDSQENAILDQLAALHGARLEATAVLVGRIEDVAGEDGVLVVLGPWVIRFDVEDGQWKWERALVLRD